MIELPRFRFTDRVFGKLIALAVLSVLFFRLLARSAENQELPWLRLLFTVVVLASAAFVVYELLGLVFGLVLARTPLSAERRFARRQRRRERAGERDSRLGLFRAPQALALLGAYLAVQVGVWIGIPLIVTAGGERLANPQQLQTAMAPAILLSFLVSGGVVLVLFRRQASRFSAVGTSLGALVGLSRTSTAHLSLAAIAGLLLGAGVLVVTALAPVPDETPGGLLGRAAHTPGMPRFAWAIAVLFFGPLLEEFLFRGALLEGFRRSWGPWVAGSLVTATFIILHLAGYWFYWPAMVGVTVLALCLLFARIRSGSLGPPVALHSGYNFVMVMAVFSSLG
jgi:membrane protease YdiL (CAAX protease family)